MKRKEIIKLLLITAFLITCCIFLISCSNNNMKYVNDDEDCLVWWSQNRYSHVNNMADSVVYLKLSEETGVNFTFEHPPKGEHRERFLVMNSTEDLPDIISHDFINDYPGGVEKALDDGLIIPLNDIIDKYCPNMKAMLEVRPDILNYISTSDGRIFCFPSLQLEREIRTYMGPFIRKDILDKTGLGIPETVDEWYEMLVAMKKVTGSEPFSFYGGKFMDTDFLIGAYGLSWGLYIDDSGQIHYGAMEEAFEDFILELKRWYDEGLISSGIFTDSVSVYQAKARKGRNYVYIDYLSAIETYQSSLREIDEEALLIPVGYPVLEKEKKAFSGHIAPVFSPYGSAYVTSANEHLVETARLLDYAYSSEGNLLFNFGIEGITYEIVNGNPVYMQYLYNSKIGFTEEIKKYLAIGPYIRDYRQFNQMMTTNEQKNAVELWNNTDASTHELPWIPLNGEESTLVGYFLNSSDEILLDWLKGFFTVGRKAMTFEQLRNELQDARVDEVIAVLQKNLDEMADE